MKALISDKARKILNDPQGSRQLMEVVVSGKEGEVELSDGSKYTVGSPTVPVQDATLKYKHFKGCVYTYICDALLESDEGTHVIVYEDDQGRRWVRPRTEFYGTLEYEGETVRRFEKVEEE